MWSRYCNPTPRIALFVCLCLRLLPHLSDAQCIAHRHTSYVWASALDSPKKSSLCIFGNGMKDNHFLMSWWEDGSYLNILWGGGNIVMVTSIICQRYNIRISSFLSDPVTSLQRKQSFLAMLELLSTVRWGLSSMNIGKQDIFFLKTAVSQSVQLVGK